MKTYKIKITGEGTAMDIVNALDKILHAIHSRSIRENLDSPEIEDLDGAEWEDCTLMTEISLIEDGD